MIWVGKLRLAVTGDADCTRRAGKLELSFPERGSFRQNKAKAPVEYVGEWGLEAELEVEAGAGEAAFVAV